MWYVFVYITRPLEANSNVGSIQISELTTDLTGLIINHNIPS